MLFVDRRDAGRTLARLLADHRDRPDVVVLGLPRGGVPVAFEVARALQAPLDVLIVRKLGIPGHEEYAMGAIASGGLRVMNPDARALGVSAAAMEAVVKREQREIERRERLYRHGRPPPVLDGHIVILVDDGLATGSTMRAAAMAVRQRNPKRIVVAVPVASIEACEEFRAEADEVVCASTPHPFMAVGAWYHNFEQTSDDEVRRLLDASGHPQAAGAS